MSGARAPVVVKMGGSLHTSGALTELLARIARVQAPMIIVPGGGRYADSVRARQNSEGFDDVHAHELALQAMGRMADEISKMMPRTVVTDTMARIHDELARQNIPVWSPFRMMVNDRSLPQDWSTTSDALAAALAERIEASSLFLIKSIDPPASATPHQLAGLGIIDPVFPAIVTRARLPFSVIGPTFYDNIEDLLSQACTC